LPQPLWIVIDANCRVPTPAPQPDLNKAPISHRIYDKQTRKQKKRPRKNVLERQKWPSFCRIRSAGGPSSYIDASDEFNGFDRFFPGLYFFSHPVEGCGTQGAVPSGASLPQSIERKGAP
jgi:hypothetical protein